MIESKDGSQRKEVFLKNGKEYLIQFFDPKTKKWLKEWDFHYLPPIVKIEISGKLFQFVLPHGNRMVIY
jgi:hypothetical protein